MKEHNPMSQNRLNNKKGGLIYIGYSSRIITVLFMILILIISIATLVNIAVIYKSRRSEFGAGHQMLGKALTKQEKKETALCADEIKTVKEPKNNWFNRIKNSRISSIFKQVKSYTTVIEKQLSDKMPFTHRCVDFYGASMRYCGKYYVNNKIFNGFLRTKDERVFRDMISPFYEDIHTADISPKCLDNLLELKNYLDTKNINLYFILAPEKDYVRYICSNEEEYERKSYSYKKYQQFIQQLVKAGIDHFDTYNELQKVSSNPKDWHYRTDHHWRIENVFHLMPTLTNTLRETYHFNWPAGEEFFNEDRFEKIQQKQVFLGSAGRKCGRYFIPPDDFIYYIPRFKTDFTVDTINFSRLNVHKTGSFNESILFSDVVNSSDYYSNRYFVYLEEHYPERVIINNENGEHKLLIVFDSFGMAPAAFLSLLAKEVMTVDLRGRTPERNLYQMIDEFNPDLVLFVYNTDYLQEDMFWFR